MTTLLASPDDEGRPDKTLTEEPRDAEPLPGDAVHDLINRNRDGVGNRKAYGYAFNVPTVDESRIEETELLRAIEVIRKRKPGLAAHLEHTYNHKLLPAGQRPRDVRAAEERWFQEHNARAIESNKHIDQQTKELEDKREQATAECREALDLANEALAEAHKLAADKVACSGGEYDPSSPTAQSVLDLGPNCMQAVAAELNIPWTPGSTHLLPMWLSWVLSIVVGTMVGLSFGLMAHYLDPDTLTRQPAYDLPFALIGSAAAILGRAGIKYGHRQAAERSYLGLPWRHRIAILFTALLVDLIILVADSFVEVQGLLAAVRLQDAVNSLSGSLSNQTNEHYYFLAAIIVSIGYVTSAAWEGYLAGRQNLLTNRIHQRCREIADERKREPAVMESLAAIAQVNELRRQVSSLETRIGEIVAPFNEKIQSLGSERLQVLERFPERSMQRVQDALDNFNGAQEEFNAAFEAALRECEDPPVPPPPALRLVPLPLLLLRVIRRRASPRVRRDRVKR